MAILEYRMLEVHRFRINIGITCMSVNLMYTVSLMHFNLFWTRGIILRFCLAFNVDGLWSLENVTRHLVQKIAFIKLTHKSIFWHTDLINNVKLPIFTRNSFVYLFSWEKCVLFICLNHSFADLWVWEIWFEFI